MFTTYCVYIVHNIAIFKKNNNKKEATGILISWNLNINFKHWHIDKCMHSVCVYHEVK